MSDKCIKKKINHTNVSTRKIQLAMKKYKCNGNIVFLLCILKKAIQHKKTYEQKNITE